MRGESREVILVNMPFHGYMPSLGLSLLKSCLAAKNISSKVLYFGLPFAERLGRDLYHVLANGYPRPMDLLGEWIFSTSLFDYDNSEYIEEVLVRRSRIYSDIVDHTIEIPDGLFEKIREYQSVAPGFVAECAEAVLGYSPKVVGIGSVFHQQMSSLSLAKRIKARSAETLIVVGGGNCEGVTGAEIVHQFPFVDAVVSGEAELVFPQIVQRHLQSEDFANLKGVYTPGNVSAAFDSNQFPNAEKIPNLDDLPYPDYDDFFEQRAETKFDFGRQVLFESSRGCWWGERSHCTFCGISSETMPYRSKSPQRAFEEISFLSEKYNSRKVHVVDCILDLKYFKDFLPKLAERNEKLDIFYEVKANLKKDQLRLLFDAGVTTIQPGIESFRNSLLQLMGKGVTALQNIQLLKWCKELGVRVSWNILWGFPGEDPQEYHHMTELIPHLTHLPAPQAACRIRLDRFSPNYERAKQFGITKVKPHPAYFYLYPFPAEVVSNLAYFFDYDYSEERDVMSYTNDLWHAVKKWWDVEGSSDLFCMDNGSHLLIWDLRPVAIQPLTVLTGMQKILYGKCQVAQTASELKRSSEEFDVQALLEPIVNRGLMIQDGKSYLSLAIPLGVYQPKGAALQKFCEVLQELSSLGLCDFASLR
ncbi:RiPP maturation radical SAM C-methyltransferase [bacterium]|nr:RiPP maturation radical SAM C-methyltransferase [bacterium]